MSSAVDFPVPTKRSLRFKRFSWNKASDGSFPPIALNNSSNLDVSRLRDSSASIIGLPIPSSTATATANNQGFAKTTYNDTDFSLLGQDSQSQRQKQSNVLPSNTISNVTSGSAKSQASHSLADGDEMLAGSLVNSTESRVAKKNVGVSVVEINELGVSQTKSTAAPKYAYNLSPQRKPGKGHQGKKKRKGTYLGPFWDDEAGSLPTSTATNDLDFDSLLSQMVKDT